MFKLEKATRKKTKLRLALSGPSGSGKTYSALMVAEGLGGRKICVIDTERASASLYSDKFNFDTILLEPDYSPQRYIAAVEAAENAGCDIIIIDSITHEWSGEGGCLDIHNSIKGKNSYMDWGKVTPLHNRFIDKMLSCKAHLIVTMRSKTVYDIEDRNGKKVPKKIGTAPQQRDGMEYEFTCVLDLDISHNLTSSKDRTGLFSPEIPELLDQSVGEKLLDWLNSGVEPEPPAPREELSAISREEAKVYADSIKNADSCEQLDMVVAVYNEARGNMEAAVQERMEEIIQTKSRELGV